jgi:hypothetical protein
VVDIMTSLKVAFHTVSSSIKCVSFRVVLTTPLQLAIDFRAVFCLRVNIWHIVVNVASSRPSKLWSKGFLLICSKQLSLI